MKSITLAYDRGTAAVGCAYVAPLYLYQWFRWEGSRSSGILKLGAELSGQLISGLQVFDDGEWHPVKAFAPDWCGPLTDMPLMSILKGELV